MWADVVVPADVDSIDREFCPLFPKGISSISSSESEANCESCKVSANGSVGVDVTEWAIFDGPATLNGSLFEIGLGNRVGDPKDIYVVSGRDEYKCVRGGPAFAIERAVWSLVCDEKMLSSSYGDSLRIIACVVVPMFSVGPDKIFNDDG